MTVALGCVADDYTGASDLAIALATNGLRVVQTIGVPDEGFDLPAADAVVVALKSRSIEAEAAVSQSLRAHDWLTARGAMHTLFKVCSTFDSTDAGNIGQVTDALRAATGARVCLVNPGFPAAGRRVFQGHLFVHDELLSESPLKDHPLNPMRDSNLVRVLARQSRGQVGLVPLQVVEQGIDAVRASMSALADRGIGAVIVDAVDDRHFEILGETALAYPLSTGASGLGIGLARALVRRGHGGAMAQVRFDDLPSDKSYSAAIAGSCSKATLEQIACAEQRMPVRRLDIERAMETSDEIEATLAWARPKLKTGPVLIASSRSPVDVDALQSRYGRSFLGERIEATLAAIAHGLTEAGVGRLVVAGGETSGAVVNRLGFRAFRIGDEIAPGVPALQVIGAAHAGLRIALKSGNFGSPDFFAHAVAALA